MDGLWGEVQPDMRQGETAGLISDTKKDRCLKWMSLLAGGLAHAMLASNLIFYVYINDIKAIFRYDQTEVEIFASMLNAGIGLGFLPNLVGKKLKSIWVLVFGLVLSSIGVLLLWSSSKMVSFYESKSWLMAIYFLMSGLGGSVAYIMSLRFNATNFAPDKRGRIVAFMFIFIDMGMISFTLIYYQVFAEDGRFHKLMIVILIFNAIVYIFCMIFLRSIPNNNEEISVEQDRPNKEFKYQQFDVELDNDDVSDPQQQSFKELLTSVDYQLLAWFCSSIFAVSLLLSNNMTVLTKEEGLSSFDSIITLIYPPLVITSALTFSLLSDKAKHILSRISFLIFGAICLTVSSILNAFLSTSGAIVGTAVVFGAIGTGIVYTIGPTAMSEFFHIDNFMRNWGLVMFVRAVVIIILHVIFGALYDMELKSGNAKFCKGLHCTRYGYMVTGGVAVVTVFLGVSLTVRRNRRLKDMIKCLDKSE